MHPQDPQGRLQQLQRGRVGRRHVLRLLQLHAEPLASDPWQGVQQSEDWKYVVIHMTNYLKGIVSASNNISKKGNIHKPAEMKKIVKSLHDDYGVDDEIDEIDYDAEPASDRKSTRGEKGGNNESGINDSIKSIVTEETLIFEDEGEITITYFEKEGVENISAPFDYIFSEGDDDDKAELQVILIKNHPLWSKKVDDEARMIVATSDAIYRMLVEKLSIDTSKALKIRNEWVRKRTEGMN